MRILLLLLILSIFCLSACAHQCKSLQQRCNGTILQLCDTGGTWRPVFDCKTMSYRCGCDTNGIDCACEPSKLLVK